MIVTILVGDFLAETVTCAASRNSFKRVLAIWHGDSWYGDDHESILAIPPLDVRT